MNYLKTADIRQRFLQFFKLHGHTIVSSSSLVPNNDPTLLFTNAGMNQFKDVFLGYEKKPYSRATSVQKCVRAGGKHNDLENVGYTTRHLTFFEMLGNFSFGDYFKEGAITLAWEFLTSEKFLAIPAEKLWVTVYKADKEAYDLWRNKISLPAEKIIRIGDNKGSPYASDNFWQMGDTGPCGPCTEIFYDHGPEIAGGPPGSPEEEGDRFVEIWNCVFMQFNRNEQGKLLPLNRPCVDTGMGLERISAVVQGRHSNFDIDLFRNLLQAIAQIVGVPLDKTNPSFKVIADHIRTASFLIADGVLPGNEGRAYVLRRIIRRAIRHGVKLGAQSPFFYRLVPYLVTEMGEVYSELAQSAGLIEKSLKEEEEKFSRTLSRGLHYLQEFLHSQDKLLSGEVAFKLYDTYGFPLDLTKEIAEEKGIGVDEQGFERAMETQKQRSSATSQFKTQKKLSYEGTATPFLGDNAVRSKSIVLALFNDQGDPIDTLAAKAEGTLILDKTPFYPEGGGQIGEKGVLLNRSGQKVFAVHDTKKLPGDVIGHKGVALSVIQKNDSVDAEVDLKERLGSARNHSATHLLHAALKKVLGQHVSQRGSLVESHRLRFDFLHPQALSDTELKAVEDQVNAVILADIPVSKSYQSYKEAVAQGAIALFGEKYGEEVRVVRMGDESIELCGGMHVERTGQIGLFKILSESGIASGIRRIEAITGITLVSWLRQQSDILASLRELVKVGSGKELFTKVENLIERNKNLEKSFRKNEQAALQIQLNTLLQKAIPLGAVNFVSGNMETAAKELREALIFLSKAGTNYVSVLFANVEDRLMVGAAVSAPLQQKISAKEVLDQVLLPLGGKGGGKKDIAQGVASARKADPEKALTAARDYLIHLQ